MVLAALTYTAIRKTAIDYSIPIFYPDEITLFGQGSSRMTSARIFFLVLKTWPNYHDYTSAIWVHPVICGHHI